MAYRIEFSPKAEKAFRRLPREAQVRLKTRIDGLAGNPRPPGSLKMSGPEGFHRLRVGEYRVIYLIEDDIFWVLVVKLGHRRDIYRR